jgi:hypothetical protein
MNRKSISDYDTSMKDVDLFQKMFDDYVQDVKSQPRNISSRMFNLAAVMKVKRYNKIWNEISIVNKSIKKDDFQIMTKRMIERLSPSDPLRFLSVLL